MTSLLLINVGVDTLSFAASALALQKLHHSEHMHGMDYIEYAGLDAALRYFQLNCSIPLSSSLMFNDAVYRWMVLTAGKSVIDIAKGAPSTKIKENAIVIGLSEPVRLVIENIRSRFMTV